ncbi:MAG: hypothetical protein L0Z53_00955 [Acidobacteriales bacterium]|nr:hypothetical protein [Terriglobales bacterium]
MQRTVCLVAWQLWRRQEAATLWRIRLPGEDGRQDEWSPVSAGGGAPGAKPLAVRASADVSVA